MKKNIRLIFILISLLGLGFFSFNNCSQNAFLNSENSSLSTDLASQISNVNGSVPEALTDYQKGSRYYVTKCSSCHGSLESSTKRNRSSSEIQDAIGSISQMSFLKNSISPNTVNLISIALNMHADVKNGPPNSMKLVVKNREMLAADFSELFLSKETASSPDSDDLKIKNSIAMLISNRPEFFGANCSRYDANCLPDTNGLAGRSRGGFLDGSMTAEQIPSLNTVSQGYVIRTCEEILSVDKAVNVFLSQVSLTNASHSDLSNIKKVVAYFYRGKVIDDNVLNSLVVLAKANDDKKMSSMDRWRFVLLALCTSSHFLML
jgi:hypothetical protein